MAKAKRARIIQKYHPVARAQFALFMVPLIAIPLLVLALRYMNAKLLEQGGERVEIWWWAVAIGVPLLFPLWAKFKARFFHRYIVTLDAIMSEDGFFSRRSSEIRIRDIRNMVVEQTFGERLLMMGDISFSSAAGTHEEVRFQNVGRPKKVKELVKELQVKLADGDISDEDIAELTDLADPKAAKNREKQKQAAAAASTPPKSETDEPASEAPAAPEPAEPAPADREEASGDDEERDELYRLLAQQDADGKSELADEEK